MFYFILLHQDSLLLNISSHIFGKKMGIIDIEDKEVNNKCVVWICSVISSSIISSPCLTCF